MAYNMEWARKLEKFYNWRSKNGGYKVVRVGLQSKYHSVTGWYLVKMTNLGEKIVKKISSDIDSNIREEVKKEILDYWKNGLNKLDGGRLFKLGSFLNSIGFSKHVKKELEVMKSAKG